MNASLVATLVTLVYCLLGHLTAEYLQHGFLSMPLMHTQSHLSPFQCGGFVSCQLVYNCIL